MGCAGRNKVVSSAKGELCSGPAPRHSVVAGGGVPALGHTSVGSWAGSSAWWGSQG